MKLLQCLCVGWFLCGVVARSQVQQRSDPGMSQSLYTQRPPDPLAISPEGAKADGQADDTDALQSAIDRVAETTGTGIVLLPQGRYRVSHTLHLWSGVRLIGYGAQRPTLVLGDATPGFQSGHEFLGTGRYMLQFASRKPAAGAPVVDANEFTFYSGISNVNFEVGTGNPAAICVRFHVAQHSFLSHIRFSVGDGRAALEDVGNQADTLEMDGGDFGIVSVRTAPAWQFLLMDSYLHGQRGAAIHSQEVGMTLIRDTIENTPVAVEIPANMPEQLYARDLLLRHISRAAVVLGDTASQHHQVTLESIRCDHVARLLQATHRGITGFTAIAAPSTLFTEDLLTVGQEIQPDGREGAIALRHHETRIGNTPTVVATDIPTLPPVSQWANVKDLGAAGDGGTDDTAALQRALDTHHVLYFPMGLYRVRGTLHTRPDSVLIGLSPSATVLVVQDGDPTFAGGGEAIPVLQSAKGGHEVLSGIGIFTGNVAPRAAGLVWRGGPQSFVQDVNFSAGLRATPLLGPKYPFRNGPPPAGAPDMRASQGPSLWVREGGGGIFREIWTADTTAVVGMRVEDTHTAAVAYQISCEHHMKNEVQFHNAGNWRVYALQTEEEKPNGAEATPVELVNATDITFANLFDYRVSRNVLPMPAAVVARSSSNVRFANMHNFSMTRLPFDNSIVDESRGVNVRTHDFTTFTLNDFLHFGAALPLLSVFAGPLQTLGTSFSNVAGLASDEHGTVFFTDAARHRVYRVNGTTPTVVTESIDAPMSMGYAGKGEFLVVDAAKTVYSVSADGAVQKLTASVAKPGTVLMLPVGLKNELSSVQRLVAGEGFVYAPRSNMAVTAKTTDEPRDYFYAPGTDVAVMAGGSWKGLLQATQLAPLRVGQTTLAISEEDDKVYRITRNTPRQLSAAAVLERSGTSVVEDSEGNVYVAGAQLYIYNRVGKLIGTLETPQRPGSLAFGGPDRRTLYIGARGSLYSIRTKNAGN
ncbi:MAG: glycosyl hydrolase family 28-related protein [Janthinobacterium lividum]